MNTELPEPPEPKLPREKSDDELRALAQGVFAGHVFCDWMCGNDRHLLGRVFAPFGLLNQEQHNELMINRELGMVYEHMDKSSTQRSVDGFPRFHSLQVLNQADSKRFYDLYNEYVVVHAVDHVQDAQRNS